jgi:hypothetical protein
MQLAGLNTLDLLLILVLFIGAIIGFVRGPRPQILSLASIWLSLVATLWLYRLFSLHILQGVGFSKSAGDTMAFLILLTVFFNLIRLLIKVLTTPPEEKKKKKKSSDDPLDETPPDLKEKYVYGPLHALGGIFMGLVLTIVWTALILGILQFLFQDAVFQAGVPRPGLARELQQSTLIAYYNQVLRLLVRSVSFFVIDSAPNLLEVVVDKILGTGG